RAATVREQDGGWFVELEQPMPVGTRIELAGDVQATVTVARVHEGLGAGMLLVKADGRAAAAPTVVVEGGVTEKNDAPEKSDASEKEEKREKRKRRR
ncbi:MAG TPA: hypothetical protein VF945_12015, partial [Polyangia bacterium]